MLYIATSGTSSVVRYQEGKQSRESVSANAWMTQRGIPKRHLTQMDPNLYGTGDVANTSSSSGDPPLQMKEPEHDYVDVFQSRELAAKIIAKIKRDAETSLTEESSPPGPTPQIFL